jgi:O-acetyl-ADP-ribose deacetylase (regulator of RNase III)
MDLDDVKAKIELRQGDITELEVDAIVNSANTDLILGSGVAGQIGRKGGPVIQEACDAIGSVPLGEAVETTAGALKAKYVIHAASMEVGHFATERDIANATRSALERAEKLRVKTIAFPAIGTGAAAFPVHRCARVMLDAAARYLGGTTEMERIYFVLFDADTTAAFRDAFERLGAPPRPRRPRSGPPRRREG